MASKDAREIALHGRGLDSEERERATDSLLPTSHQGKDTHDGTPPKSPAVSSLGLKILCLLAFQNCSKNLIMRAAVKDKPDFLYSAAVIGSESTKLTLSVLWILCAEGGSVTDMIKFLRIDWWNMVLLAVPAGVYNFQQTLEYVALSNLDASIFSVLVQTKLLTTAIFSVVLLGKVMRKAQVISLVLLTTGVMLANLGGSAGAETSLVGVSATIGIAASSGFAAVYTEKVIKTQKKNDVIDRSKYGLAYMQLQLALTSLVIIGMWATLADLEKIRTVGLWHNFNGVAALSVVNSALGGLTVAGVLKFSDAVLKGYATAVSVLLTGVLSMFFFGTSLTVEYFLAAVIVACSMVLYNAKELDQNMCTPRTALL